MEYPTYLIHYGIPGQKWGVRRYQNPDGTYTDEGLIRRHNKSVDSSRSITKKYNAEYFRNNKYDSNKSVRMRADFNKAYREHGPGNNVKDLEKLTKKISDEAYKQTDNEFKEKGIKKDIYSIDQYQDRAFELFDKLSEEYGLDVFEYDIAHLTDLGYSRQDAKDIAKWFGHSLNWDYVWDEKTKTFINPEHNKKH